MKQKLLSLSLLCCFFFFSCSNDDEIPVATNSSLSFILTGLEPLTERYQDTLIQLKREIEYSRHYSDVMHQSQDSTMIVKSANFLFNSGMSSENQCEELVLKLEKMEAKSYLEYDSTLRSWDYKLKNDEHNLFYEGYDRAVVEVNFCYLRTSIVSERPNDNFKISKITKVLVDNEEEWWVQLDFKGIAKEPVFWKEPDVYFEIREGSFEGVLY